MATANIRPTQLTYQNRTVAYLFKSYVFHPLIIEFGSGANIGLKSTLNEFEMTTAIFLTDWT